MQHGLLALNAFFNGLQRSTQGKAARLQQLALRLHLHLDQRIDLGLLQVWVEADAVFVGLFSLQAPLHGTQAQVALAHALEVGAHGGRIQLQQRLAFLHMLAFVHHHLANDAATQMLHCLAFGVDHDRALAGHAFVQGCQPSPQQKAAKTQPQGPQAHARGAARVSGGMGGRAGVSAGRWGVFGGSHTKSPAKRRYERQVLI